MHMRRVSWLLLMVMLVLGVLTTGAFAQYGTTSDQTTVQSQTTVAPGSMSNETTVSQAPAMTPGTPMMPATGAVSCPMGMVAYNPASEVTVTGQVIQAPRREAKGDMDWQLTLRTADGKDVRVFLAPGSYLRDLNFRPMKNDTVTVIGIPAANGTDLIARQLTWNGQMYALRNEQGAPMWAGARRSDFSRFSSMWNSHQVRTISGNIDRIENFYPGGRDMGPGVAIRLQVAGLEDDMIPSWQQPNYGLAPTYLWVYLGPRWYVERQLPDLRAGQNVTITGTYATWRNQPVIIASTLQQGTNIVAFRGPMGRPMWAGGWQNWSQGTMYGYAYPMYGYTYPTVAGFTSITGTIESVQNAPVADNLGNSTLLTIRTPDNNLVTVAVAPTWFTEQTGLQFAVGSPITLMGSYSTINGQQMLIANQLTYNNQSFMLQNINGVSTWNTAALVGPCPMMTKPSGSTMSSSGTGTVSGY